MQPEQQEPAVARLLGVPRREDEQPVDDAERQRVVAAPHVRVLQVVEQSHEHVALGHRGDHVRLEVHPSAGRLLEHLPAVLLAHDHAARERIEQQIARLAGEPHEEVTREADALERHADAPAQLEHQDAEREWDAPAALDDLVEQRVAGTEVIVAVAADAQLLEQKRPQPRKLLEIVPRGVDPSRELVTPVADPRQLVVDVHVRVALGRHEQRGARQLERLVGALDQVDEVGANAPWLVHGS